ncbi:MAG TPA: sugar ABC transporter ATP-binding protein [Polyangia bacterium]|nr:sugar ABC transporter ATP-binding protein [Polyangia bacterium]
MTKRFGATQALGGVDLVVAPGEVHALLGQNGAGKSTLMKVLSGAERPDAGEMKLDGAPYAPADPQAARHAGVAMIYQELSLAPHLTVAENILLGVEPVRRGLLDRAAMRDRAARALAELQHPSIRASTVVGALPIAAQQIVEIARAVAVGCRVLVLDEPTSSLAQADAEALFALIARLRAQGHAIIYITHFIEEAQRLADRFTVLRDGVTVGGGKMATANPATMIPEIVDLMVGRRVEQLYPRGARHVDRTREPLLEVTDLAGAGKPARASFTLHRGEVLGIAGLVGAGRTELLRALAGLDPIVSGRVKLGASSGTATPGLRWQQGMALVSENRKAEGLALGLSVADNLTLSKLPALVRPSALRPLTARWIAELDVRCQGPDQPIGELSGGNQQKIAIARLLHHGVDVLLLDEPTRGIDVASKAQIYDLIDGLVTRTSPPKAVLMVSSYLPELLGVCDRIAVMCRGRLGPARPASEWTEASLVHEAALGSDTNSEAA